MITNRSLICYNLCYKIYGKICNDRLQKMYLLLCKAAYDSLDILSEAYDTNSMNHVRFWLKEAMIRAEHVHVTTAEECEMKEQDE